MKLSLFLPVFLLLMPAAAAAEEHIAGQSEVEKMLRVAPKSYQTHYAAGRLYESKGMVGQAQDEYKLAIKMSAPQPEAFKRLAQLYLRSHDYNQAMAVMVDAVKRFPNDYGTQLTAGYVMQNADKLTQAFFLYEKARTLRPKEAQTYIALADVSMALAQKERALNYLNQAYKLGKPTLLLRFEKAKVLSSLGKFDQALVELEANYKEDPLNWSNNKIYTALLLNKGDAEKALEVNLCFITQVDGREMAKAKYQIGMLLRSLSDSKRDAAIARALGHIKEPAKRAIVHFALGDVLDRLNQSAAAIPHYQAGIKEDPLFARGYLRLGEDLELVNKDYKGAMANYKKARELDKAGKDKEITMRLKQLEAKLKN